MFRSLLILSVPCLAFQATAQCLVLEDSTRVSSTLGATVFGSEVAALGDEAFVSSSPPNSSGIVFHLRRAALDWAKVAEFGAPTVEANSRFGSALAVAPGWLAVGQPNKDVGATDVGVVHLYQPSGASWTFRSTITGSTATARSRFGASLALEGTTLVVGADGDFVSPGKAFVFEWDGSQWSESQELTAAGLQTGDLFGAACTISGNWLAVSAPLHSGAGAVFIYQRVNGSFQFQFKATPGDASAGQRFGSEVALAGNRLLVSSPYFNVAPSRGGKAYVLARSAGFWVEEAHLHSNDFSNSIFGASIGFDGSRALIGAPGVNYARVFERGGTAWTLQQHLTPTGTNISNFATAAALDGDTLYVGMTGGNQIDPYVRGQLFTWRTEAVVGTYCTSKTSSSGCTPVISISGSPNSTGTSPCVVSATQVDASRTGVVVYGTSGPQAVPFLGGWLCFSLPLRRTVMLQSGGQSGCDGNLWFDLAAWIASDNDPALQAGTRMWGQFWIRDPGFNPPNNAVLSDAFCAILCP